MSRRLNVLLSTVLLLSCSAATPGHVEIETHIVGGGDISALFVPYQVALRRRSSSNSAYAHHCGGVLLDERTVLTAAHCVYNRALKDLVVVAGSERRDSMDGIVTRVEKLVLHELYNASITDNDVALVFVSSPFPLAHEKIAAIQLTSEAPATGTLATVSGWGTTTEGGLGAQQLQQVKVPLVESEQCQTAYYWRPITAGMLCAGFATGGRDACKGDSGGPLVVNDRLVGVVSWGEGCARVDYPGVYVNVAHFLEWIAAQRAAYA